MEDGNWRIDSLKIHCIFGFLNIYLSPYLLTLHLKFKNVYYLCGRQLSRLKSISCTKYISKLYMNSKLRICIVDTNVFVVKFLSYIIENVGKGKKKYDAQTF